MKVYEFWQNNSGGVYDDSPLRAEMIYVEANNAHEANQRLVDVTDIDFYDDNYCPCCGPRWSEVEEYDLLIGRLTISKFAILKVTIEKINVSS